MGLSGAGALGNLRTGIARSGAGKNLSFECRADVSPVQRRGQGRTAMNTGRLRVAPFRPIGMARSVLMLAMACCFGVSCTSPPVKTESAPTPEPQRSNIKVDVRLVGPIVVTTSAAEFQILPSGYVQASLLEGDQRLTLDQPGGS